MDNENIILLHGSVVDINSKSYNVKFNLKYIHAFINLLTLLTEWLRIKILLSVINEHVFGNTYFTL